MTFESEELKAKTVFWSGVITLMMIVGTYFLWDASQNNIENDGISLFINLSLPVFVIMVIIMMVITILIATCEVSEEVN